MIGIQQARDWSGLFANRILKDNEDELYEYIYRNVMRAIVDGQKACITYYMHKSAMAELEAEGFVITEEIEDDCTYWVISWE